MRWLVGDLQGCARELERLLTHIRFDPARDQLWCLGDLLNRGPDSLAALRLWRDIGGYGVLGNHEVYALCAQSKRWPRKHDQLQALYDAPDGPALLERLRQLPVLTMLPAQGAAVGDVWLVHAGLHPQWTELPALAERVNNQAHSDDWLESDAVSFMTRVRCCDAQGERSRFDRQPQDCPAPYQAWDSFYRGQALVVHGHWAWRGHYRGARTLGLDSGCVYGGPLTAWCMDEDRIVQIQPG